jgi:hypothetical protein
VALFLTSKSGVPFLPYSSRRTWYKFMIWLRAALPLSPPPAVASPRPKRLRQLQKARFKNQFLGLALLMPQKTFHRYFSSEIFIGPRVKMGQTEIILTKARTQAQLPKTAPATSSKVTFFWSRRKLLPTSSLKPSSRSSARKHSESSTSSRSKTILALCILHQRPSQNNPLSRSTS